MHRDRPRDEPHRHGWRHFPPQSPVGSHPIVDNPLYIEGALQGCFSFGIKVLASAISAAPSSQGGIVSFIMVRMHLRLRSDGGK
jgi:hypothetical protein